ncbi:LTA synthase family protein [Pseudoflavonifractor phocaeensis]|uniref:LTA synthase family protein n=1 Tax=Pseudoflavonifractor phocaeensis TaxID=1870988 RepID=UPI0025A3783E|nr:LTA synthase family protein [Pseudoflavonifractor phocaeensis]MDM8239905.1 LTA synthase family protein [Pseudoflavonifractor phocaeensis]
MRALLYRDTFPRLVADMKGQPWKWLSRLVFLLGPWAAFWMVEILNQNDVFSDLQAWQVLMNLVWYYILFLVCRLVLGRRRRAATLAICLSFLIGLVNHYVLRFRGRILFPADVASWKTAANVADAFDFSIDVYMEQAAVLLVAYLFLVWMCQPQPKRDRLPLPVGIVAWVFCIGYSFAFFFTGMLPALGIYTQQWVTQANGFLLNFTVALRYSSVDKPDDYSHDLVLKLMDEYPSVEGDPDRTEPINIIVVMNESFSDLTIFDKLEVSQDPTPFLHSLSENTIKGWMYSPVTGGGTASVEFEYLTGFATIFQPPHTVAYQLYTKAGMPSLASLLRVNGYESTAFHPYKSSGWNRPIVYNNMRFDNQLYQEDVDNAYLIRNYISDQSDYETIFQITDAEQGDPQFIFNVTMQNHSSYAQGWNNLEKTVTVSDELRQADYSSEQYLSLVLESDQALEQLVAHYEQSSEPTMIVFFGDHQPPLKNAFYEVLYGKPLSERTTEEVMQQYQIPFFIWTNYDIEEQEGLVISPNYLGVLTAQMAGMPLTGFMNFLSQLYEEMPAITPVGIITADGEYLEREELNEEQQQWLETYETLNYCGMVDLFDEARPMFCFD